MKETKIIMPELKPGIKSATLCAWLKEEGDTVKAGEPIFEVETEKVVTQVEATASGKITKMFADEGDEVEVNETVAVISEN